MAAEARHRLVLDLGLGRSAGNVRHAFEKRSCGWSRLRRFDGLGLDLFFIGRRIDRGSEDRVSENVIAIQQELVDGLDEPGGVQRLVGALYGIEPWGSLCQR